MTVSQEMSSRQHRWRHVMRPSLVHGRQDREEARAVAVTGAHCRRALGPKILMVGRPNAPARCMGPASLPSTTFAPIRAAWREAKSGGLKCLKFCTS